MPRRNLHAGYTLVELLVSIGIAAMLLTGLQQLMATSFLAANSVGERTDLARDARFAMGRMVDAVRSSDRLLLPLADNPATNWDEHIRIETVPASAPQGSSTLATAVLAVTVSHSQDIDLNGIFDADNDGDGLFDEDPGGDLNWDFAPGIFGIDDDGDGTIDEQHTQSWLGKLGPDNEDDDEDDFANEDNMNGLDDDGDGNVDEDQKKDLTGDALSGIGGFDDDGDGVVDEDDKNDDDEDGSIDEDWLDAVVYYLDGDDLVERRAVPWDENEDSTLTGEDFVESDIADKVTLLRIERMPVGVGPQLIDITLELTGEEGETISLNTRVRLGGAQ